ncbi:MAG: hypothetical protein JXQ75_07495 [Phycisphaerae bacterium]|nr:hypothetical protein [Phycisphaerae bacterium]
MRLPSDRQLNGRTALCLIAALGIVLLTSSFAVPQDEPQVPSSGTRQTIITNQFNAATAGLIQERRPGLWVQQGIAVHQGSTTFFTGVPDEEPNFFRDTFNQVVTDIVSVIQGAMDGLNLLVQNLFRSGGSSGGGVYIPIQNAATTGQGTRVPID